MALVTSVLNRKVLNKVLNVLYTLQVWNVQNGHLLQQFEGIADCEVTGIVPVSDKKEVLTVGWSRKILAYDISKPDVSTLFQNQVPRIR